MGMCVDDLPDPMPAIRFRRRFLLESDRAGILDPPGSNGIDAVGEILQLRREQHFSAENEAIPAELLHLLICEGQ